MWIHYEFFDSSAPNNFCCFSFAMGEAADNWLAWMDWFLTLGDNKIEEKNDVKKKILQLVDLYYAAIDAPKKGVKVSFKNWKWKSIF